MHIYFIVIIILLVSIICYLIYQNSLRNSKKPTQPQIIYVKEKQGLYDSPKPVPYQLPYFRRGIPNVNPIPIGLSINNKIGLLTSIPSGDVLNLYVNIIDPHREIYSYYVEDKNGFVIPLDIKYNYRLTNGEIIDHIPSKIGKWNVLLY